MRPINAVLVAMVCVVICPILAPAQSLQPAPSVSIPRLVNISGVFQPLDGQLPAPVEAVTLSIYSAPEGGALLWQETQVVPFDKSGRFTVLMGATQADGIPPEVFASGQAHWMSMQVARAGEVEQPRVRIASVPYALRSSDAETLGGLPASAYLLAPTAGDNDPRAASAGSVTAASGAVAESSGGTADLVLPGTTNFLAKYVNGADVGNSAVYETGGNVGIGTTTPLDTLHLRFTNTAGNATGLAVQNLGNTATSYSGLLFYDQFGALAQFQGFNNSTHEYRINNVAPGGSINIMIGSSSKLLVANNGTVSMTGNVNLGTSTSGTTGNITKNGIRFLHDFGFQNTFVGAGSGNFTMSGQFNTGVGAEVLSNNASGLSNTAFGGTALRSNTAGSSNVAVGYGALQNNTTASDNSAFGDFALGYNVDGSGNSAVGFGALDHNVSGSRNAAVGMFALGGVPPLGGGSDNVAIGYGAGSFSDGSNDIYIGASVNGPSGESNVIRIGNGQLKTYVAGIRGMTTGVADAIPVMIDSTGQLGTVSSSRRFKDDIHDMGEASRALFALRPVTFRYTKPYTDGATPLQYGLVAEEVAEVFPDLAVKNADGGVDTVHYETLSVLLLNEVQKQRAEMQQQEQRIQALERRLDEIISAKGTLAPASAK